MLNEQTAPVAWYLLLCELEDAKEGIDSLLRDMTEDNGFDEAGFRIHMAHVYGHLNRAWNGRNATDAEHEAPALPTEWDNFPTGDNAPVPF